MPLLDYLLLALCPSSCVFPRLGGVSPGSAWSRSLHTSGASSLAIAGLLFTEGLLCAGIPHPLGAPLLREMYTREYKVGVLIQVRTKCLGLGTSRGTLPRRGNLNKMAAEVGWSSPGRDEKRDGQAYLIRSSLVRGTVRCVGLSGSGLSHALAGKLVLLLIQLVPSPSSQQGAKVSGSGNH